MIFVRKNSSNPSGWARLGPPKMPQADLIGVPRPDTFGGQEIFFWFFKGCNSALRLKKCRDGDKPVPRPITRFRTFALGALLKLVMQPKRFSVRRAESQGGHCCGYRPSKRILAMIKFSSGLIYTWSNSFEQTGIRCFARSLYRCPRVSNPQPQIPHPKF